MHLSLEDTDAHFKYVADILKPNAPYIFSTLNPDYELQKGGGSLVNGEKYDFLHGKEGEYGTFYHFYKTSEFYKETMEKYFTVEKQIACVPITDKFKETHARYYNTQIPMAYVFVLRKK